MHPSNWAQPETVPMKEQGPGQKSCTAAPDCALQQRVDTMHTDPNSEHRNEACSLVVLDMASNLLAAAGSL